jgi:hypothetical protein
MRQAHNYLQLSLSVSTKIRFLTLELPFEKRRGNQEFRSGTITCSGNIVKNGQTQQSLNINIMGLRLHGIPKKDQHINLTFGNHGSKLLVTAQRTGLHPVNRLEIISFICLLLRPFPDHFLNQPTGGAGGYKIMPGKDIVVAINEIEQFFLAVVMGNHSYILNLTHGGILLDLKPLFPFRELETNKYKIIGHKHRAFAEHAVSGNKLKEISIAHGINGVFQAHFLIFLAVGIYELLLIHPGNFLPCKKFIFGRGLFNNMADSKINTFFLKPSLGFAGSGSTGIMH